MEDQLGNLLPFIKMIDEKMEKKINWMLRDQGVTFAQIRVIVLLSYSEKTEYSLKELERIFQVSQQTMVGIIKRLENKKLITTHFDTEDKRVKKVSLTEQGKAMGAKARAAVQENAHWLAGALTPEELETLLTLLQKIYKYMG